jgi:hypothetical protein
MEKETLKNIMHFLEKEDNKSSIKWKLLNNEPLTEEDLDVNGDLVVKGNLDLDGSEIRTLPKGLKVGGYLSLAVTKITSLPKGLTVGGFLSLAHSDIESLPEGLEVEGSLNLSHCKKITSLPKGLYVGWDLNIKDSNLQKYTDDELKKMIKPGSIEWRIIR